MPSRFSFNFKKTKRRSKYNRKRGKAKYRQQMLSTSTVTKIARKVAVQQDRKQRMNLISRRYLFPGPLQPNGADFVYNPAIHEFGGGLPLYFPGRIVQLSNIRLADTGAVQNAGDVDDPLTQQDEVARAAADGVNVVGKYQALHDTREGDTIFISGFNITLRATLQRMPTEVVNAAAPNAHVRSEFSSPMMGATEIRWAIVLYRHTDSSDPNFTPLPQHLVPWHPWGYQSGLDVIHERDTNETKFRTLLKGRMFLSPSTDRFTLKEQKRFVRFKRPIEIKYAIGDQTGKSPQKGKVYLVLRSNIPNVAHNDKEGWYTANTPNVIACTKLFYYE